MVKIAWATRYNLCTYSVFSLSDLEYLELLPACALGHLPVDLVVDPLGVGEGAAVLPVGAEGGHELAPVDHAVAVVELVGDCVHLEAGREELVPEDALDELVPGEESVGVLVELAHEVRDAGLLVVVVLEEALPPLVPVEVLDLLELLEVAELVLEPAVPLPGHHPDVAPLVPQRLGARVLDALLVADAGAAALAVEPGSADVRRHAVPGTDSAAKKRPRQACAQVVAVLLVGSSRWASS